MKPSILLVGNFLSSVGGNCSVGEELADRLRLTGYPVISTSNKRLRLLRLLDMLFTAFIQRASYKIACVEVYSGAAFIWAETVCGLLYSLKKPYILNLHGGNLPAFARRWPERVRRLLKGATTVTAPSQYLLEEMRFYRDDICLIPNPLAVNCYPYHVRSKPEPRLIWLRAFHSIYNPQMAPMVILELSKLFPEITLLMVGPDKGDGTLQKTRILIEKLGLDQKIEIIPGIPKSQVSEVLGRYDIFINTTNIDNTPVSVIEAMTCGLCVVSTNVGGIPYLLENRQDALLVPPNDPLAMALAVKHVLGSPTLAGNLSRNARRKTEKFDWSVVLPQWEKLIEGLIPSIVPLTR